MSARDLQILSWAANLTLPLGLLACGMLLLHSPRVGEWLAQYHAQLSGDLRYLQLSLSAKRVVYAQLGVGTALIGLAASLYALWPCLLLLPTVLCPTLWLSRQRSARSVRIEEQLDTWLLALSNALKANPSLGESIVQSARVIGPPLSQELALLHKETRLGVPLDRALCQLGERVRSPIVSTALATLRVARGTGGNLSETLAGSAQSLREMARLEGVVRTKTAEGRAQAFLIGVLPVPLVLLLHSMDRKLLEPLWSTTRGHMIVVIACLLWLAALGWARRIVHVDI